MRVWMALLMLAGFGAARAEVSCYRTPEQAALQVGQREGGGYRLDIVRRDALGGKNWATVRSCLHPEWPAVVVRTSVAPPTALDETTVATVAHPVSEMVVANGAAVTVVMLDGMARLLMSGVAQGSGRVGDRVWVRIAPPVQGSESRLALAVVRSAETLEIGQ